MSVELKLSLRNVPSTSGACETHAQTRGEVYRALANPIARLNFVHATY
jgi:hypothetical protein